MQRLPALTIAGRLRVFPMADRSAEVLIDILLTTRTDSVDRLAERIVADPPLAVWIALTAIESRWPVPKTPRQAAESFVEHIAEALCRQGLDAQPFPVAFDEEACATLVENSLIIANLAANYAGADDNQAAEQAFLGGLLHNSLQWLAIAGAETVEQSADVPEGFPPILPPVNRAIGLLSGREPQDGELEQIEICREKAAAGRWKWLEKTSCVGDRLPELAARVMRLEQLERRFQEALEAEKLAAMAELAAGAGHEINNPLAIIGGHAQVLLKDEPDPERRRVLSLIHAQVKRAHEMIADMRLFARPPRPELQLIEIVFLTDSLLAEFQPQASERKIELVRRGDSGPLELEADPAQMSVALGALVRNASEALGEGGRIEVSLHATERTVEIRVADNGPGILPEHRRHLFDPFFSARQAGRGLGLGLSKCWRIVTNHGGQIRVESEPGQGAVFILEFPRRAVGHET